MTSYSSWAKGVKVHCPVCKKELCYSGRKEHFMATHPNLTYDEVRQNRDRMKDEAWLKAWEMRQHGPG